MNITKTITRGWILWPLLGIAILSALCAGSLIAWVITGPRSINSLTPYIESALTPAEGYRVKIESSEIRWEGWQNPLGMSTRNVEIVNDKGVTTAYFPEVVVQIYLYKLILGKVEIKALELIHPNVTLVQNDDGSFFISSNGEDAFSGNSVSSLLALITSDSSNPLTRLKSLVIQHASLSLQNRLSGVFLQSLDASLEIKRKHGRINGTLSVPITYGGNTDASLFAEFSLDKHRKTVDAQVFYKLIPTSAIHNLFPGKAWLEGINLPLSGAVRIASDLDANISNADFVLESGKGSIKYPEQFEEPLNLEHARITGSITNNLSVLNIAAGRISFIGTDLKTTDLSFKGMVARINDDYAVQASAETANVPVNDVHRYWPLSLEPPTRKWVTTRITNGTVVKADVTLNFKPGELKLKDIPEQALASTIAVRGASVRYLPNHPPATDVNGTVKFTGRSMDARVTSAKYMSGSEIGPAGIRMPDMYPDDVRMFIDMDVKTPAKDAAAFLALPRLDKAAKLGITQDAAGQVNGNAKFDFIALSKTSREGENMNYAIATNLMGVSQKNFLGGHDIENANMNMAINNKGLKIAGTAVVNTVPMAIDLTSSFNKEHDTSYSVKCTMPLKALPKFSISALDDASGSLGVAARFSESDTADSTEARLDLTNADIHLPEHGFTKKPGIPAVLELSTEKMPSGNIHIKSFLLKGADMLLSGTGEFDKATGNMAALTFDHLRFANNDLSYLDYRQTPEGIKLSAEGNAFDISPYLANGKNLKKNGAYDISIKVVHLWFGDKREMRNTNINANCAAICRSAQITATLADKNNFSYQIKDGKLTASSDNAGELARVIGVIDNVEGGALTLNGTYAGDKIEGNLTVKDYTLKRAPVLTKILTIASLTGFMDTLSGNGIAFSKLTAPFTYRDGIIILKDGKTHGSALGLTASGTIDTDNSTIDLSGVIIPSYTMNSLIGNVPIIGDLLMGGKDKGILALNYALKGNMNDPSVSVNPLSAFTPGFLRDIFDVFDQPAPDIDKIVEDRKKQEESKKDSPPPAPASPPQPKNPPQGQ